MDFNAAVKKVQSIESVSKGKTVSWYLLNGNDDYKIVFYELVKRMERSDDKTITVSKNDFTTKTGLPSGILNYVLFKFARENLVLLLNKKIYIQKQHLKNWESLCLTLLQQ